MSCSMVSVPRRDPVSNEQRSVNPPRLPWFHLGRRLRSCSSMESYLRRTDDCRRLPTRETSDLNSAETCLASFFRVAQFHVLSERLVNLTVFFFLFPSFDPTDLSIFNESYSFVPFSSACSLSTLVPLFYSITSLFRSLFCRPGDRRCSSAAAPPLSRPPEANDLARWSALSSPLLDPLSSVRCLSENRDTEDC